MEPLIATLPPVTLAELGERAALMHRVDRKYVLGATELAQLLQALPADAAVLEIDGRREMAYASVYFDTPDLQLYRDAAHRHRRRFKVRTRTYCDSGETWLEVKTRGVRRATNKERIRQHEDAAALTRDGRGFVDSVLAAARHNHVDIDALRPQLTTGFRRTTLFLPSDTARVTVDGQLRIGAMDGREGDFPSLFIVETKSGSRPSAVDHALWSAGMRPQKVSKYAIGCALFDPQLPANKWRRVIAGAFLPSMHNPELRGER